MASETSESGNHHHQHPFLTNLRASNEDFGYLQASTAEALELRTTGADSEQDNSATIRSSNVVETPRGRKSIISNLFVAPKSPTATTIPQNEEEKKSCECQTDGKTMSDQKSSFGHPPILQNITPETTLLEDSRNTQHQPANDVMSFLPSRPQFIGSLDRSKSIVYKVDYDESINGEEIHLEDNHHYGHYIQVADEETTEAQYAHGESSSTSIHSFSPKTKLKIVDSFLHCPQKESTGPLQKPETIKRKDRAVSFDCDAMQRKERLPPAMNGPSLVGIRNFGDINSNMKSDQQNNFRQRPMMLQNRAITLDEILTAGRYELEAETNILKALDDQQSANRRRHQRFRSETSTILSGVPDSLSHDFTLEYEEGYDTMTDPLYAKVGTTLESFNLQRGSSAGRSVGDGQIDSDLEEGIPLIKTEKRHRRSMSVEDRLAGLAIEYYNLEDNNGKTLSPKAIKTSNRPPDNGSSADAFRHNAALVSRIDDVSVKGRRRADVADKLPCLDEGDEDAPHNGDDASSQSSFHNDTPADVNGSGGPIQLEKERRTTLRATDSLKDEWELWRTFFNPRKENILTYSKTVFLWIGIPLIGVAALIFYGFDNPPTGLSMDESQGNHASASWWLIFFMRQVITLSLALFLQLVLIDFFSIASRVMLKILGPILTLLIVQSKGWPFVFFWWSVLDFAMLYGDRDFAQHWLYWQDHVGLFNSQNPSGHVVNSTLNTQILTIAAIVSAAVAVKRFVIGLYLSRNTFIHYGEELAKLLHEMILISHVGHLAKKLEKTSMYRTKAPSAEATNLAGSEVLKRIYTTREIKDDDNSSTSSIKSEISTKASSSTKNRDLFKDALDETQKMKLFQLLEDWEEPERQSVDNAKQISISAVLRFRNALNLIQNDHAFSFAFGSTQSREECIESAQNTYKRLLMANPTEPQLHFETLGLLAIDDDGEIDQEKAKDLVKIFRPRRDGILTMLDFVKSTDKVYKEFRLLQASIQNSSQIDRAFENILNIFFYAVLTIIVLMVLGLDPLSLFLSLSSVILAFAFMIGPASSKYFEGILFILVRRPYGIGDIIHVSGIERETSPDGSFGWIVQKVTLFETVATWLPTFEKASFNNGSLASSRIINWARSPNAKINILLHFPIETRYEQIEMFKRAVEEYMKVRPREWLILNGFRVNRIYTEQSYMQVTLQIQHRESWQSVVQVCDSKANLVTYCNEVQKKMGMKYNAPPLPVDLRGIQQVLGNNSFGAPPTDVASIEEDLDLESRISQFRMIAKTRHQIRHN